jgi:glycosyltransferase involved in cell wall biosynthesis
MSRAFPDADLHVLWNDAPDRFLGRAVYETWMAQSPLRRHKALALPAMLPTWRRLSSPRPYDWLLVSSHLFAHHARFGDHSREAPKLVYAHTPARYVWNPELDKRGANPVARAASSVLKPLDRRRAQEAVAVAANSRFVRDRIRDSWNRDADVLYPPVDVERILSRADWATELAPSESRDRRGLPSEYLLGASRFVPYKRLDLVIEAGEALGIPVILAGSGPAEEFLRRRAANARIPVSFVTSPSDAMLFVLYKHALAFVFPAVEDFGIMPVEAMACGTPVIVNQTGGAAESVMARGSGAVVALFEHDEWLAAFAATQSIDRSTLPAAALQFSNQRFIAQLQKWVSDALGSEAPVGGHP